MWCVVSSPSLLPPPLTHHNHSLTTHPCVHDMILNIDCVEEKYSSVFPHVKCVSWCNTWISNTSIVQSQNSHQCMSHRYEHYRISPSTPWYVAQHSLLSIGRVTVCASYSWRREDVFSSWWWLFAGMVFGDGYSSYEVHGGSLSQEQEHVLEMTDRSQHTNTHRRHFSHHLWCDDVDRWWKPLKEWWHFACMHRIIHDTKRERKSMIRWIHGLIDGENVDEYNTIDTMIIH